MNAIMSTLGEGVETAFGDYRIRIIQLETDRHISVLHVPSGKFVFHDYVPAGFPPLPGAFASEEECMKYAVEEVLKHSRQDADAAVVVGELEWKRGSFPRPGES